MHEIRNGYKNSQANISVVNTVLGRDKLVSDYLNIDYKPEDGGKGG